MHRKLLLDIKFKEKVTEDEDGQWTGASSQRILCVVLRSLDL